MGTLTEITVAWFGLGVVAGLLCLLHMLGSAIFRKSAADVTVLPTVAYVEAEPAGAPVPVAA